MVELRIDGTPAGKGRPRFSRQSGRVYTDSKTVSAETRIREAWGDAERFEGPVVLEVEIVLERPQGHYRVSGELSASGVRSSWPSRKPDVDNALKLVADALNKVAYRDDSLIAHAWVLKRWANPGEREHTVVRVRAMNVLRERAA